MYPSRARNRLRTLLLSAGLVAALTAPSQGHDVPPTVLVRAFVRPAGAVLRFLVRVPLEAMRDVTWPLRGPGYLEIAASDSLIRDAARQWIAGYVEIYEGDIRLAGERLVAARVSLPSDRSFGSYDDALDHVTGPPLSSATQVPWQQAMLDVLFEYPITSDQARFSIRPALAHLGVRTTTVLRFQAPGGAERAFEYVGDPGLVRLDPRWHQAAWRFVQLGFDHILDGVDHLLFILCLVIPFRKIRPLLVIVTAFTVAHSVTLVASAAGLAPGALWFPPLIETLIAASIVFMALENIVGPRLERRWIVAFGFGLVHGFGFSFVLRDSLQFAGAHLLTSLLSFNAGVELGQVLVLVLAIPALNLLFRYVVAERMGTIILSALVAHTAWHWMADRWQILRQYQFRWPALDAVLLANVLRGVTLVLIVLGIGWLLSLAYRRLVRPPDRLTV